METATWRLIHHRRQDGAWNMAVDDSLLESVIAGESPPILRLYDWDPPCLSLGYAQPFSDVDSHQLQQHHWSVTRRPTGGRAILHTDEITYAVIGSQSDPRLFGSVLETYRTISSALIYALALLGIKAQADKLSINQPAASTPPVCFEVPSNYEITVNGLKILGSAQARRQNALLQHGALPLTGDITRILEVLTFPDEVARSAARTRLLAHATHVSACLQQEVSWDAVADALEQAFTTTLNISFVRDELSTQEVSRARALVVEKYDHPDWIHRT